MSICERCANLAIWQEKTKFLKQKSVGVNNDISPDTATQRSVLERCKSDWAGELHVIRHAHVESEQSPFVH